MRLTSARVVCFQLALIFAFATSRADAAAVLSPTGELFHTMGSANCETWISARAKGTSERLENYLVGVLDGLAIGHGFEFWQGVNGTVMTSADLFKQMDEYCATKPSSLIAAGATAIYQKRTGWR